MRTIPASENWIGDYDIHWKYTDGIVEVHTPTIDLSWALGYEPSELTIRSMISALFMNTIR